MAYLFLTGLFGHQVRLDHFKPSLGFLYNKVPGGSL